MRYVTFASGLAAMMKRGGEWRRFLRNRSGSVAIIFALAAVPVIAMLGFAIDYELALSDKAKLDGAADAAAMVGITTAQAVIAGGGSAATAQQQGNAQATASFAANTGSVAFLSGTSMTTNVQQSGQVFSNTVTYQTLFKTSFSGLIGLVQAPIRGKSSATLSMPVYINYYIVVDVSQSMGVGSTPADMTNLYNRSAALNMANGGCVFGCHVTSPGDSQSMESVAHNISPRIALRIDAAVSAIQTVISQAQQQSGSAGNIQIGLYTMSGYPMSGSRLTALSPPSANYATLSSIASTIDLGPNVGAAGFGDSDFVNSLNSLYTLLPSQGSGNSASSPVNYVVLITDGVQDTYGSNCPDTHCDTTVPASQCASLQTKASVGVIYTVYNPIYANNNPANGYDVRYNDLVLPFANTIAPALQACATNASLYFEATNGPAISTSLSKLFASTAATARLSQ